MGGGGGAWSPPAVRHQVDTEPEQQPIRRNKEKKRRKIEREEEKIKSRKTMFRLI
jgi:hypothetical protein